MQSSESKAEGSQRNEILQRFAPYAFYETAAFIASPPDVAALAVNRVNKSGEDMRRVVGCFLKGKTELQ